MKRSLLVYITCTCRSSEYSDQTARKAQSDQIIHWKPRNLPLINVFGELDGLGKWNDMD